METVTKNERWLRNLGLIFIIISLALRFVPHLVELESRHRSDLTIGFVVIAFITLAYFIIYSVYGAVRAGLRFWKYSRKPFIFLIILLSIGCFALNESIHVFSPTATWLTWLLGITYAALAVYAYFDNVPATIKPILYFIMGWGTAVTLFYSIVLAPTIPFAIIGILFFGLGLYLLAPFLTLISYILIIRLPENRPYWKPYTAGLLIPLVIVIAFTVMWIQVDNRVAKLLKENNGLGSGQHASTHKSELPNWLYLDMHLEESWITEKYLLKGVEYASRGIFQGLDFDGHTNRRFDPLVLIASATSLPNNLYFDDRVKILEARYDFRHMRQRRLWSGRDLATTSVNTDIQVWPEYRMAYVDQEFVIHHEPGGWGGRQQEAVYTFYLPDGAVASSLSLWIEGKEEFSRLTTKSKADSAYVAIVGRERRDPALLHWQEGNTLVVTVFPCTMAEDRKFTLGVTVPLKHNGDEMDLPYIAFSGPYLKATNEVTTIRHGNGGPLAIMDAPMRFTESGDSFVYEGPYKGAWDLKLAPVPLATQGFSFNGHQYSLKPYQKTYKPYQPIKVVLDVNESWSSDEIGELAGLYADVPVYVTVTGALVELKKVNQNKALKDQMNRRYSVFPFYAIKEPQDWLIITKTSTPGILPGLLKDTDAGSRLKAHFSVAGDQFNVVDIGNDNSLYLNTFRQFGVINYHRASIGDIKQWQEKGQYPAYNTNPAMIELETSAMTIVEDTLAAAATNTPDHLLRLFAYNKVLHQIGGKYFKKDYVEDEYIELAKLAHVVTPISSMVVLETIKDYERFGIEESNNSLKNAGQKAAGAVPEPHEWALILLSLVLMGWLYYRRHKQTLAA